MSARTILGLGVAALALVSGGARAQAQAAPGGTFVEGAKLPDTDEGRIAELVTATHILAARGIIDGRGHVSVRSARDPTHYFMARTMPPAEVTARDIIEFDADSRPVGAPGAHPYSERFIHGAIYRARPDVQSVVHCHAAEVLPFTVSGAPLKAIIHTAYFLGADPAPVFDLAKAAGADNRMLVDTAASSAALAGTLGKRSVVLMRGHGMTVAAPTLRDAVYRSIYTIQNATVEAQALALGRAVFLNRFEVTRSEWIDPLWDIWRKQAEGTPPPR